MLRVGVADEGIVDLVAADVFDVLGPLAVAIDGIDGEADDLGAALRELLSRPATAPSSVVQTGVKSLGCEKRTA